MKKQSFLVAFVAFVSLLLALNSHGAARTASVSGLWSSTATWGGQSVPVAGDTVTINTGINVTGLGGANQACTSIQINGTGTLTVDSNTLTLSANITVGSGGGSNARLTIASGAAISIGTTFGFNGTAPAIINNGTFSCAGGGTFSTGSITNNGIASFTGSAQAFNGSTAVIQGSNAVLNITSSSSTPFGGSTTLNAAATGNTVNYGASGGQNIYRSGVAVVYYNLTYSGSGAKSMNASSATVNGTFSRQGTATASGTLAYGAGASLEYKGSSAQTPAAAEFPTSSGPTHLIIDNTSGFTLSSGFNRIINGTVTLKAGVCTLTGTLTLGNGATIIRTAGAFSGTPTFGTTVNVTYNNPSSTTTGSELPASSSVLNNLTIDNLAGVILNANATVNGNFAVTYVSGTPALAVGGNTLALGTAPVNITVSGSALTPADYTIVSRTSGSVSGSLGTVTVTGSGAPYSPTPTASTSSGALVLTIPPSVTTYTVSYDANGGTGSQTDGNSPYDSGDTVTVLGTGSIARTGYTFSHWNTASDGSGTSYDPTDTFSITADTTLYAIWTINTYTVSYDANGGTGSQTDGNSPYDYNATVTVLGTGSIARTGYTFSHWNTASDNTGTSYDPTDSFSISANITLYAIWTINNYSVSYDGNGSDGGTAPSIQNGDYNTGVTAAANTFTRTGYSFIDWNTAANGSGTAVAAGANYTIPAANTTLYAQWSIGCAAPEIVGGINSSATSVCAGSPVIMTLTNVTGSGPLFYQWQTNDVDIAGATNVGYTNLTVALTDAADYTCIVTNECGAITSSVVALTVNSLPSAPTAGDVTVTYDGSAHTGTATPVGGSGVIWFTAASGGSVTTAPLGTDAGTYAAYAAATNDTTGCESATRTLVTVQINKADASVTVTPYSVVYDGSVHTATAGNVTGVNGETGATVGIVNLSGTAHTAAGSYPSDSWTLTGGDNYNDISAQTISNHIAKATASVTVMPYNVVYDGSPHSATAGTVTGVNGETGTTVGTVDLSGTTHTAVGVYTSDYWTLTGGANYNDIPPTTITNIITAAPTSYALTNSGAWNVAENWSPNGLPGAIDTVTINTGTTLTGLGGSDQTCSNLTVQGTGVLIVDAGTLTVGNVLTVGSSGAAALTIDSGATLTVGGAWNFGGSGSSLTVNGTYNCAGANGSTAGNFTNNGTATFTGIGQSFNNGGVIVQGENAILNLNSSASTPIGSSPTMVFTNVGNTVSYGGSVNANTKGATYYNLTFTGSARRSMGSGTVINNKLSIQGSVNDVRFGSTATYAAGATLEYKSSVAQTQGNTSDAFPATSGPSNLIIENSSGFTLSAARTVNGTVTLADGTFSSANNLTLDNGATIIRAAGNLSGTPTFGDTVNVTYNDANSTTTGPELPTGASVLNNLTIDNPAGVVLNGNATVNGTFEAIYVSGTPVLAAGANTLAFVSSPVNITVYSSALTPADYIIVSSGGTTVSGTLGTITVSGSGAPYSPAPTASTGTGQLVLTILSSNIAPVAKAVTNSVALGGSVTITNNPNKNPFATDADSDPLTFDVVSGPGAGSVSNVASGFVYTSTGTTANVWDSFQYSVSDGNGGADTNTMSIYIGSATGANLISATEGGGQAYLTYAGIPGQSYVSERATDLTIHPIMWTPVATNTAGSAAGPTPGKVFFTNDIISPASFFRTQAQ